MVRYWIQKTIFASLFLGLSYNGMAGFSGIVDKKGFDVKGDRKLGDDENKCNAEGIIDTYLTRSFVASILTKDSLPDLVDATYNHSKNILVIEMVDDGKKVFHEIACVSSVNRTSATQTTTLDCVFTKRPKGLEEMKFTLQRIKKDDQCLETAVAFGHVNPWAGIKGKDFAPLVLHQRIAAAIGKNFRSASAYVDGK